jgi:hypothetical protein
MSDIYLQITETPAVVTLSAPVISGALSSTVTVANVVSVNVVTMPAITVQAASVTTVIGTVTVGNSVTIGSLPAISGTVTANLGNVAQSIGSLSYSTTMPSSAVRIGWGDEEHFNSAGCDAYGKPLPVQILLGNSIGDSVTTYNPLPISGTVTIGSALPAGTNQIGAVTANNQSLTTGSGSVSGTSAVGTDVLPSTDVNGFAEMMIQFTGAFPTSANAQFQVSNDNSTFVSQAALQVGQTSPQATISALGMYKISLGGARYIRLRVTVQGSTSNYIYSYTLNPRTSFNATQPVHIVSQTSLASGTNRIGVVTIGAGTVTIGAGTEQIGSVTASISGTVPVSGTFWQATQPVSGTVTANTGLTQPLTDTQLRATPVPVRPRNGTLTVTTGSTSASANTSAQALASNASRQYLLIQNVSDTDMNFNFGATATTDHLFIAKSGGGIVFESGFVPTDAVNVICSAASKKFYILSS